MHIKVRYDTFTFRRHASVAFRLGRADKPTRVE